MEALWSLEDKWKLSTQEAEALLLFVFATLAVTGLCATTMLKKKKKRSQGRQIVNEEPDLRGAVNTNWPGSIKRALIGTVRWSGANKWEETHSRNWRQMTPPLLGGSGCEVEVGWLSHNSVSPVWQRPILMGERCEFPRFSGVILYDEQGQLLQHSDKQTNLQEKPAAVVTTTLRDLL